MAKVLLVEDDNNLREIYQARLMAEGYDIVAAQNGEEALVVAKQNKPDLIISDVMMPRISGFEMLDILRGTDDLKNTKVIMLTALGQAEDQKRASGLGADKYLVKSQVTLEDIVNAAKELLGDGGGVSDVPPAPAMPDPIATSASAEPADPTTTSTASAAPAASVPAAEPVAAAPAPEPSSVADPIAAAAPVADPAAMVAQPATDPADATAPAADPALATVPVTPPAAASDMPVQTAPDPATDTTTPLISMPPDPATAMPADPAAASNDQTLASAVAQLNNAGDVAPVQPPSVADDPAAADTTAPVAAPAADPTSDPIAQVVAPTDPAPPGAVAAANSDSVDITGKKVIQPLSSAANAPDLSDLLAKEPPIPDPAPSPVGVVVSNHDDLTPAAQPAVDPAPDLTAAPAPDTAAPLFAPAAPAVPAVQHVAPVTEPVATPPAPQTPNDFDPNKAL